MSTDRTCRWCGTDLEARTGRGRKPAYCNARCRRQAEFRVRELRQSAAAEAMSLRIYDGMDEEWALGAVIELRIKLLLLEAELVRLGSSPLPNYSTIVSNYSTAR